jgi:hypothetical protein
MIFMAYEKKKTKTKTKERERECTAMEVLIFLSLRTCN